MTGREVFKILDRVRFIFLPLSLIGKIWLTTLKPHLSNIAILWRYYLYLRCFKRIGTNVSIHKNVTIKFPDRISLGSNVSIHTLCYLDGEGELEIGNDVSIAHATSILTVNHAWTDSQLPIKYNPLIPSKVKIEDDVWIGAGVRILAGVTIGRRCVIAAGAVVTKSCEPNSIYAGVPARKVKEI